LDRKSWKNHSDFLVKNEKEIQDPTAIIFLPFQLSVMKHIYYL